MISFDARPFAYDVFTGDNSVCKESQSGEHEYDKHRDFERPVERGGRTYRFQGLECKLCGHICISDSPYGRRYSMGVVTEGWAA